MVSLCALALGRSQGTRGSAVVHRPGHRPSARQSARPRQGRPPRAGDRVGSGNLHARCAWHTAPLCNRSPDPHPPGPPETLDKILLQIAAELKARPAQVQAAVELLDGGATVPFIARYRKEATDGLDDIQLRELEARLAYLRELEERRAAVLKSIDEQGKLTPELRAAIGAAPTKQELEDLYLPFKLKRRTKAHDRPRGRPRAAGRHAVRRPRQVPLDAPPLSSNAERPRALPTRPRCSTACATS